MIVTKQVTDKLQKLPIAAQEEVLDFVEFLLEKSARRDKSLENQKSRRSAKGTGDWTIAKSYSLETSVILDDRREIIYED